MALNEADTCRIYITPKLRQADWETNSHSLTLKWEQQQRLTLLEATVFWSGELSTSTLTLADNLPMAEVLEPAFRQVDQTVLQTINQAIVSAKAVQVRYQSMPCDEPVEHRLCPHALVFDGMRWHARAFSDSHQEFRDFVLARVL